MATEAAAATARSEVDNKSLTAGERKKLHDYLQDLWDRRQHFFVEGVTLAKTIAGLCTEHMGRTITEGLVTNRIGPEGSIATWEWPNSARSRKGRNASATCNLLILALAAQQVWLKRLYTELVNYGHPLPQLPEIPRLKELMAQAEKELAETDTREPEER